MSLRNSYIRFCLLVRICIGSRILCEICFSSYIVFGSMVVEEEFYSFIYVIRLWIFFEKK